MTQEEKQLLLKDLCARLPYGVKVKCGNTVTKEICELIGVNAEISTVSIRDRWAKYYLENVDSIKPYLRPMLSMTEEENKEYAKVMVKSQDCSLENSESATTMANDWLLSKGFDVRGLISKGLALVAPEGMY